MNTIGCMDWQDIVQKVRLIKENFERSYKCLNTDRPTKDDTLMKHVEILFSSLEEIRVTLNVYYSRLTQSHKAAAHNFFWDVRGRLINVLARRNISVELPLTLHEEIPQSQLKDLILAASISSKDILQEPSYSDSKEVENMPQSATEFLGLALKIVPVYDGKPENLQSFLDALDLLDSVKETHESIAVNVVKTKLTGSARNLVSNETTINEVARKLKGSVKGESTEVLTAKLMNVKQNNRSANVFVNEVEELTKALSNAYIADGLTHELAEKYSTQTAVKAMTKNASSDRVRLIMASGNFGTMNDAVSKFVNSCTETTSSTSGIMYYNSDWNRSGYGQGRGRGNNRGRGRGNQRGRGNGNGRGRGYGNRGRGRGGNNSYWSNDGNSNRNVRVVVQDHNDSENQNRPLRDQWSESQ